MKGLEKMKMLKQLGIVLVGLVLMSAGCKKHEAQKEMEPVIVGRQEPEQQQPQPTSDREMLLGEWKIQQYDNCYADDQLNGVDLIYDNGDTDEDQLVMVKDVSLLVCNDLIFYYDGPERTAKQYQGVIHIDRWRKITNDK
jgi:hypothetical protein